MFNLRPGVQRAGEFLRRRHQALLDLGRTRMEYNLLKINTIIPEVGLYRTSLEVHLFADAEGGKDEIQNIVGGGFPSKRVQLS
jgi:hypothetical protein